MIKALLQFLISGFICLIIIPPVHADIENLDKDNGFAGYKFSTSLEKFSDIFLIKKENQLLTYKNKRVNIKMENYTISELFYVFQDEQLEMIVITTYGSNNSKTFLNDLQKKYGFGIRENNNKFYWIGDKVVMTFDMDNNQNSSTAIMTKNFFGNLVQGEEAIKNADKNNGFKNYSFGGKIDNYSDLLLIKSENDYSTYRLESDLLKIGRYSLKDILYTFYKDELAIITLDIDIYSGSGIKSVIEKYYGKGNKDDSEPLYKQKYYWIGKNIVIIMENNKYSQDSKLILMSNKMFNYFSGKK